MENDKVKLETTTATQSAEQYATSKGLSGIQVFLSTDKQTGHKCYVLFQDQVPIDEFVTLESLGCRLDMMALANGFNSGPMGGVI